MRSPRRALGAGAEALEVRAWAARYSRDMAAAIAFSTEGARIAHDASTRARCLLVAGMVNRGIGELARAEQLFTDAAALEPVSGLGPISAYLAPLRLHQGRARQALAAAEPAVASDIGLSHTMPAERTLQVAIHANGMLGRPAAAPAAVARLGRTLAERGTAWRYRGYDDNYRSWVLRNLADPRAKEISDSVVEEQPLLEIHVQAELDRADSRLWRADLDGAARILDHAAALTDSEGFLQRYRCEQRAVQLRARLALAAGEPGEALDHATASATHASEYGDARYEALAAILLARARHRFRQPVDREEVAAYLRALPEVAGLESWWMTAEAAADLDVDEWWSLAERRVAELAAAAGENGQAFQARARRRLDELRATSRTTRGA